MLVDCRRVEFKSPEYEMALALRTEVLRKPLGLTFNPADLAKEIDHLHFVALHSGQVVGTLMLVNLAAGRQKMRQVAVANELQGHGVGRQLIEWSERWAVENGTFEFELNARETAVPFYLKLGYQTVGEPFLEVGLPHFQMRKSLLKRGRGF